MDLLAETRSNMRIRTFTTLIIKYVFSIEGIELDVEWMNNMLLNVGNYESVELIGNAIRNTSIKLRGEIKSLSDIIWRGMHDVPLAQRPEMLYYCVRSTGQIITSDISHEYTVIFLAAGVDVCFRLYRRGELAFISYVVEGMVSILHGLSKMGFILDYMNLIFYIMLNEEFYLNPRAVSAG